MQTQNITALRLSLVGKKTMAVADNASHFGCLSHVHGYNGLLLHDPSIRLAVLSTLAYTCTAKYYKEI